MTMTIKTSLLSVIIFITNCLVGQTQNSKFSIVGKVKGYNNGSKIYLNDLTDGSYKKIDSSIIKNGNFKFIGELKTKFLKSSISNDDYSDRVTLWLEKGQTTFSGLKGNFNNATIKGGGIQQKFTALRELRDTLENTERVDYFFIKQNPNSIIAAYTLSSYCNLWTKDTVAALYNTFSKEVKQTSFGNKIFTSLSLKRNIKIGDKYVDFSQKDTSGIFVTLSNIKSKCILLEFWGSWCGPCREKNPLLVTIYNEFKQKGFEIVGIASETNQQQWITAIKKDGLNWINLTDFKGGDNHVAITYGVTGYPSNFLIDNEGTIIAKDVYGDQLRNWLLILL